MLWETLCMLAHAMGGGPGVDTHTSFSEGRRRACVHRFQHFCWRRVRAPGVEGRLRRIFQAELNHLGHARSTQLRDKCHRELDAGCDAHAGQDIAIPHDAALVEDGRIVRDGNILSGGGVTAGIDFVLALIAELRGPRVAEMVQLGLEYAPQPPFDSGRPDTAPAEMLEAVNARTAPAFAERPARMDRQAPTHP